MSMTTLRQHAPAAVGEVGGACVLTTADADAAVAATAPGTAATGGRSIRSWRTPSAPWSPNATYDCRWLS